MMKPFLSFPVVTDIFCRVVGGHVLCAPRTLQSAGANSRDCCHRLLDLEAAYLRLGPFRASRCMLRGHFFHLHGRAQEVACPAVVGDSLLCVFGAGEFCRACLGTGMCVCE
jgi:hypothetical protein